MAMDRNGGEVVVVGGGILGCSVAVHLVERGLRPVLIDSDRPGQGTSTGSFASISAFGKDPADYYQLAVAGMSGWSQFANRLGGEVGLRRAGELRWISDPEQGELLARKVADARGRGYSIRLIDRAELARLLPDARLGTVTAACFAPNDGQVEPPLVLAAGAGAVQVAAAVGLEVPTVASPGMLIQTRPLPPITDRVVYVPGGPGPAVHLRQRADGSVLVGEGSQETPATDPGRHHAQLLLAQAARFLPALAGVPVERWWLAWRAMPTDRLPIVGPLPWLEGLYLVVSHSGVTLAPVLGRLVAAEVAEQTVDGLLAPFRPSRFAERATRVMLEVESVFREPIRQHGPT
jgi:glycine/D-amino acid oxidase-like deaminating enzyme